MDLIERGRKIIRQEAAALAALADALGESFEQAIRTFLACEGRIVVTGVGKAGNIARKVSATLASTGTPAMFLHPADGLHGDLGMVTPADVALAFSNMGQSDEVLRIVPYLKHFKIPLVAVTSNEQSELARLADILLLIPETEEACSYVHAPTCSTTAMLALGDALAVTLLEQRGFTPNDFALRHPGGALGKRLLLRVADVMHGGDENPVVLENAGFKDVVIELTGKNMGAVSVTDASGRLIGIVTDGDLKRILAQTDYRLDVNTTDVMTRDPMSATPDMMGVTALGLMEDRSTYVLPVVDEDGHPVAMLRLHDLIQAGLT
jgi:arabinose-5-phosphate isomerase